MRLPKLRWPKAATYVEFARAAILLIWMLIFALPGFESDEISVLATMGSGAMWASIVGFITVTSLIGLFISEQMRTFAALLQLGWWTFITLAVALSGGAEFLTPVFLAIAIGSGVTFFTLYGRTLGKNLIRDRLT